MSPTVPEIGQQETLAGDVAGIGTFLIDPQGAAKRVFHKWFWVAPVILVSIVSLIVSYIRLPIMQHAMETMPLPANMDPAMAQKRMDMGMTIQRIAIWFTPVLVLLFDAIYALILLAAASVLSVNAKFKSLFNLVAGCSVIQLLALVAGTIILKAKGEVTMAELQPALGFDIFMPEGANRFLTAFLGYFSIFEIWWIVMMVLVASAAFRISKGKAFGLVLPVIVLGLLLRIVGAIFQRT